jgi:hypothetical protein
MEFLNSDQCSEWCRSHGFASPTALLKSTKAKFRAQYDLKIPKDAGKRIILCRFLWDLTAIDRSERLVWISGCGAWPSEEHMPLFYRLREALGEKRYVRDAPGHLISMQEDDDGFSIFIVAALFLWDCWLYSNTAIIEITNDEVGTIYQLRDLPEGEDDVPGFLTNIRD